MKHDFFNLKYKVAIVTGGNQGIGKVVAGYLADAGADVVIFDLNDASEVAEKIAEEYGVRTAAFVCNVTDPEDVEKNIQAAAESLLGCVQSCGQRYGTTVILDTVHGANTVKIRNYRMDENPHYGELAKESVVHLRQMFNFLQVEEYLFVTADEYSIVKLTEKGAAFLETPEPIEMKMAKEREKQAAGSSKKSRRGAKLPAGAAEFTEKEETLFEALRALRREIASEEKVPPYIVFSDKTLTHMCILKPVTEAEMLEVSGVGAYKFEKYGERFLECVRKFLES